MAKNDPISSTGKNPNTLQNHNACTTKALLLFRPGEACGLLESIFQPIVQACDSFRSVVTFGIREYSGVPG